MPNRLQRFLAAMLLPFFVAIYLISFSQEEADIEAVKPHGEPTVATTTVNAAILANAQVLRIVDGDTFVAKLDNEPGEWKIRLLGINTPETVDPRRPVQCFGKQASAELKRLLLEQRVRLVPDPQADERDKYGRLLRNAISSNGLDVNAHMVREGYAYAYLSFPLNPERKRELKDLEDQARLAERGLWAPEVCGESE